jgi:hypothetical protein
MVGSRRSRPQTPCKTRRVRNPQTGRVAEIVAIDGACEWNRRRRIELIADVNLHAGQHAEQAAGGPWQQSCGTAKLALQRFPGLVGRVDLTHEPKAWRRRGGLVRGCWHCAWYFNRRRMARFGDCRSCDTERAKDERRRNDTGFCSSFGRDDAGSRRFRRGLRLGSWS